MEKGKEEELFSLEQQAVTLRFLSKVFLELPQKEELLSLADTSLYEEIPFAGEQEAAGQGLEILRKWAERFSEEEADRVYQDGMNLFVGPRRPLASPWESVYRNKDHLLFQEETLQVRLWYQRFGLACRRIRQEPDDHIALEIEFVAALTEKMKTALEEENTSCYHEFWQAREQFLAEHLSLWFSAWCALVETHAKSDFYRGMALLVKAVLTELSCSGE